MKPGNVHDDAARIQEEEALVSDALAQIVEMALADKSAAVVLRRRAEQLRAFARDSRLAAEREREKAAEERSEYGQQE